MMIDANASRRLARRRDPGFRPLRAVRAHLPGGHGAGRGDRRLSGRRRPPGFQMLSRNAALAYASESMRLTTRLMQVASWLLVQRAVREGDMAPAAACEDRYRLCGRGRAATIRRGPEELPTELVDLLDRAERSTSASATWTGGCTWRARPTEGRPSGAVPASTGSSRRSGPERPFIASPGQKRKTPRREPLRGVFYCVALSRSPVFAGMTPAVGRLTSA